MFSTQEQPTLSGFISMIELANEFTAQNSATLLNRMCLHITVRL